MGLYSEFDAVKKQRQCLTWYLNKSCLKDGKSRQLSFGNWFLLADFLNKKIFYMKGHSIINGVELLACMTFTDPQVQYMENNRIKICLLDTQNSSIPLPDFAK